MSVNVGRRVDRNVKEKFGSALAKAWMLTEMSLSM
jgi:hypothetical protein